MKRFRYGVFDARIVHCDRRIQLSSRLPSKRIEEWLSCIMANETSHVLALVQPIAAEVLFYRRFVQQPVQSAATVTFFVIKMCRNSSEIACMLKV